MGMYTELVCAFRLKKDAPQGVIDALRWMINADDTVLNNPPTHKLFSLGRAHYMLQCDSYYFDGETNSTLKFDDIPKQYICTIRCNLKNYEDEIEHFIDWITPYMDALEGDFLGYRRYEEDEQPVLLYHPNNWVEPNQQNQGS